ncbi:hypothetical protein CRI70_33000, partial [Streptomyces sp. Ru87]
MHRGARSARGACACRRRAHAPRGRQREAGRTDVGVQGKGGAADRRGRGVRRRRNRAARRRS